jgi:hypothetical protein
MLTPLMRLSINIIPSLYREAYWSLATGSAAVTFTSQKFSDMPLGEEMFL